MRRAADQIIAAPQTLDPASGKALGDRGSGCDPVHRLRESLAASAISDALAAHGAIPPISREMILRSDSSAAFNTSNRAAGRWRWIASCTSPRKTFGRI